MKDRILEFLKSENKSYAQFAEEIGVQPSGISHILSGRNNPSLDFVIKMLEKYSSLSAEWLLFGRGPMHKYATQPVLFEMEPGNNAREPLKEEGGAEERVKAEVSPGGHEKLMDAVFEREESDTRVQKRLVRVLMFFSDKTFTEYRPA